MTNLAQALRAEISRLARKETKVLIESTRRAATQHRKDIAALKRQVTSLEKEVTFLRSQETKRNGTARSSTPVEGRRFSAKSVRAQRNRLGMSRKDFAELLEVSSLTVYNWETGRSRPRSESALAALVAVRGMGKREALRRLDS